MHVSTMAIAAGIGSGAGVRQRQGFVDRPGGLLRLINGQQLAQWAIQTGRQPQFWALPKPAGPGAPEWLGAITAFIKGDVKMTEKRKVWLFFAHQGVH
jgi:hypothetical protein